MIAPAASPLYSCPTTHCRVSTYVSATAIAKCPVCDETGVLVRYPIVEVSTTARIRAALDAAARNAA